MLFCKGASERLTNLFAWAFRSAEFGADGALAHAMTMVSSSRANRQRTEAV
jgi:hypothetical protein